MLIIYYIFISFDAYSFDKIAYISRPFLVQLSKLNIFLEQSVGDAFRSIQLILNIFLLFFEDIVFLVYGLDEVKPAGDMLVLWLGVFWGREVIVREVGREVRLFIIFL